MGVGNGKTLISILKQKPRKIVAIDFASEGIKRAKEKFGEAEKNFEEAILWHAGEADFSVKLFSNLSSLERNYIFKFLNSL